MCIAPHYLSITINDGERQEQLWSNCAALFPRKESTEGDGFPLALYPWQHFCSRLFLDRLSTIRYRCKRVVPENERGEERAMAITVDRKKTALPDGALEKEGK